MAEKEEYRIVKDRIITEKQYQSEKTHDDLLRSADELGNLTGLNKLKVPAGIATSVLMLFVMYDWSIGWFWKFLIASMLGLMVWVYFVAGIMMAVFGLIVWLMYKGGAF
jgi:hypothetical protein